MKTRLIIVGGFLGAGKTTLLWESARKLSERGTKVGLITNDQAAELVDTAFLEYANGVVEEVSGSCFCCNFNGFFDAVSKISKEKACEMIIAEPVGSCTDLSATIVQPLKEKFNESLIVAPLSVLVDPNRLSEILEGGTSRLHTSAAYILRKQLEEADLILISKSDLLKPDELETLKLKAKIEWPLTKVFAISVKTGAGLEDWLNEVMNRSDAGTHLAEVDYDIYAEGEAVLGWYNASFQLRGNETDWEAFLNSLIHSLADGFEIIKATVGHLKILIKDSERYMIANMTGSSKTITIRGSLKKGKDARLTINARIQICPEELEALINTVLAHVCKDKICCDTKASKCLSPGRPNPTYRFNYIV